MRNCQHYLDIISDAMGATHLEEDTVVYHGKVGVEKSSAHHAVAVCVGRLLKIEKK